MRGASRTPIAYVSVSDRDLPDDEQTIVWIRCKNAELGNQALARYARAQKDRVDGSGRDWDSFQLTRADIEDFLRVCPRVDNYAWTPEYLDDHPEIKLASNVKGFYTKPITDPAMLEDFFKDIPSSQKEELLMVAGNQVKLDQGAKKNLSYSASLLSGAPLKPSE